MIHDAWRGLFGRITPTKTARAVEELLALLPQGVGIINLYCSIRHGTLSEFTRTMPEYEQKLVELASDGVDVIQVAGTPPFMLVGFDREQELIAEWQQRYGVAIFTSGTNQVRALKALGVKRPLSIGYDFDDTGIVQRYLERAGLDVIAIEKLPGPWEQIGSLSSQEIYRIVKRMFLAHPGCDGIHIQGGKIRMLDMVETLENDLRVPVVHPAIANAWEVMLRLKVWGPRTGYGRLLADLPEY